MRTLWIIIFAVIYLIGAVTVSWLDKQFSLENNKHHYLILIIMWILTPILLLVFGIDIIIRIIHNAVKR